MTASDRDDGRARRVAQAAGRLPGGLATWDIAGALVVAPVIFPMHRATASDCVRVARSGAPVFLKVRRPDGAGDVVPWAAAAARKADKLGIGPGVLAEAEGVLALNFLSPPWRTATLGDLQEADVLGRILEAKRDLHADGPLGWRFCPFERVAALAAEALAVDFRLPCDVERLLAVMAQVREAITAAGLDLRFCHNDGTASNVMLNGDALRLVDFDCAGDNDPWFDIAAVINEACEFDSDRRAAIEQYAGRCDERVFNRCRLYGAVDDIMWGLWGVARAATTRRSDVDLFKYGTWRLLLGRAAIEAPDFRTWLGHL